LLEHLVGLRADDAAAGGDEGRHAGHAVLVRLLPVGIDGGLERALGEHLARFSSRQTAAFCDLHEHVGVADVLALPDAGAKARDARAREIAPRADVIAEHFEDHRLANELMVIITGPWSLVPNSRCTTQLCTRDAIDFEAST